MNALNEIIRKVPTHDKPRRPLIPRRGWGGWRKWEVKPRETETETETKKKKLKASSFIIFQSSRIGRFGRSTKLKYFQIKTRDQFEQTILKPVG